MPSLTVNGLIWISAQLLPPGFLGNIDTTFLGILLPLTANLGMDHVPLVFLRPDIAMDHITKDWGNYSCTCVVSMLGSEWIGVVELTGGGPSTKVVLPDHLVELWIRADSMNRIKERFGDILY